MNNNRYIILTGGTGGHVIPAINFGNYIIDKYRISDERGYAIATKVL